MAKPVYMVNYSEKSATHSTLIPALQTLITALDPFCQSLCRPYERLKTK